MKKIIFIFFFLISSSVKAQNAQDLIDGLKKELKTNPDEKRTATIYSDLTWYYSNISTDSALVYGTKALEKANQLKDSTLLAQTYSDIGAVHFRTTNTKLSKYNYLKAYEIRKIIKDKIGMAKISANLASIYSYDHKQDLALKYYLESIDYFESIKKYDLVALTNSNIAEIFNKTKNYNKGIEYSKKALNFQEKDSKSSEICNTYNILANCYLGKKDTVNANFYYQKSLNAAKMAGNKIAIATVLSNLANLSIKENKTSEADSILKLSINSKKDIKIDVDESIYRINKGQTHLKKNQFNEAKIEFLIAKKNYTKANNNEALLDLYRFMIEVNNRLSLKDSVSFYLKSYDDLQIKMTEKNIFKQTAELETKYQTAKKEQEIVKKNNQIIIASIVALSFLLLGFLLYKNQKTKNKQQQQESVLKEALLKIEAENQLHEQRLGISKELHDNIGSQLTFVISSIDTLKQNYPSTNEKIDNQLENINAFTKNTITELRDTVWVMNTKDIDANALKERLLDNMERAKMTYPNINFKVEIDSFSIDNSVVALNLFRTIQEGINNALKYANATQIEIGIHQKNDQIEAFVKDNGVGFDIETLIASKLAMSGNGLKNMKKRVKSIKGTFNISSSENFGTKVEISVPRAI